jgi:hypothetical protein
MGNVVLAVVPVHRRVGARVSRIVRFYVPLADSIYHVQVRRVLQSLLRLLPLLQLEVAAQSQEAVAAGLMLRPNPIALCGLKKYSDFVGQFCQANVLQVRDVFDEVFEVIDVGVVQLHQLVELLAGLGQAIAVHHFEHVGEVVAAVEDHPLDLGVEDDA